MSFSSLIALLFVINFRWIGHFAAKLEGNNLEFNTQKYLAVGLVFLVTVLMVGLSILYFKAKNNPNAEKIKWWYYVIFLAVFNFSYEGLYYLEFSIVATLIVLGAIGYKLFKKKAIIKQV